MNIQRLPIIWGVMVLTLGGLLIAAPPEIQWEKIYTNQGKEQAFDVQPILYDGYLMVGQTEGFASSSEIWLVKVDSVGEILWTIERGSDDWEGARAVDVTSRGDFIIAGYYGGYAHGNFWWTKLDTAGNTIWYQIYDAGAHDVITDIHQTSDEGYIMAGTSGPRDELGVLYLIKTDGNGEIEWEYTYGSDVQAAAGRSVVEHDGNFTVAGERKFSDAIEGDAMLRTRDEVGGSAWYGYYGDDENWEKGYGLCITPDGGFLLAGGSGVCDGSCGGDDVYLVKTDSASQILWTRTYGQPGLHDRAYSIEPLTQGGYIIAGTTQATEEGDQDAWVLRINEAGDTAWTFRWGSELNDCAYAAYPTRDKGFIVVGTREEGGGFAAFLLKLGVEEEIAIAESPHPPQTPIELDVISGVSSSEIRVRYDLPCPSNVTISVYDAQGRRVADILNLPQSSGSHSLTWDTAGLPSGVYFVELSAGPLDHTARVTILR